MKEETNEVIDVETALLQKLEDNSFVMKAGNDDTYGIKK